MTTQKSPLRGSAARPRPIPRRRRLQTLLELRRVLDEAHTDLVIASHLAREVSRKAYQLGLMLPRAFHNVADAQELYNRLVIDVDPAERVGP